MTWWQSSSQGRHQSPSAASVSPTPCSSNHELVDDPDPDWVGGQLEQARLQRSGFYRRLQSASQRGDDDMLALQKSRRISPDGVDDTASASSSFEPHTSWRFYTSYDNGEWRRHAVPVLKVEEKTSKSSGCTPKSRVESEVNRSACQASESSLRRTRHPRTTAADRQQARLRMRSGDSVENSGYGRWKFSSSADNFRSTAAGGSLTDLRSVSPDVYHQSLNSLEVPPVRSPSSERFNKWPLEVPPVRSPSSERFNKWPLEVPPVRSPSSERFNKWLETTSPPVGHHPRSRLNSESSPKADLSVGSCIVDGIDVTFEEKFIIPTKYKNRENNTAAGTPEASKTEITRSNSTVLESEQRDEVTKKSVEGANVSCMTGQGKVQAVRTSEQRDVVSRQEAEVRKVEVESLGESSVKENGDPGINCDLKHDQFVIVSRFIQEKTFDEFSENCRITTDNNKKFTAQTTLLIENGTSDTRPPPDPTSEKNKLIFEENKKSLLGGKLSRKTELISEKQEIILGGNQKAHVDDIVSSKTSSEDAGDNYFESSSGRSLADDVNGKQKAELTSNVAVILETDDQKVSSSGDKVVKFVSIFYADVSKEDLKKEASNTKNKLSNCVASDSMGKSPALVDTNVLPDVSEEDDNWVVEIAVKN